jgi:hypothetical protein
MIEILTTPAKGAAADLESAFDLHERAKARTFLAAFAETLPVPPTVPTKLAAEERRLLDQLRPGADAGNEHERDMLARHDDLTARLNQVREAVAEASPQFAAMRRGDPVRLAQLRQALSTVRDAPIVVSFFVGAERTVCFVVEPDNLAVRVETFDMGSAAIHQATEVLQTAFNGSPWSVPVRPPIARDRPGLADLSFFDEVAAPFGELLGELGRRRRPICVAPHGPLHMFPLAAAPYRGGRVIERAMITYCPSVSVLHRLLATTRTHGDSIFVASVSAAGGEASDLLEHDTELFTAVGRVPIVKSGPAATKAAVLAGLNAHDNAHLACHGRYDASDPLNSGILVAARESRPSRRTTDPDHLLTVREISRLDRVPSTIVMRSCSTGRIGQDNLGDEFSGLTRTLLGAGARTVLAPLWNVDAESSRMLLHSYYRGTITDAKPPWIALWLAQRELAARADFLAHPYHWAPYVLHGEWRGTS